MKHLGYLNGDWKQSVFSLERLLKNQENISGLLLSTQKWRQFLDLLEKPIRSPVHHVKSSTNLIQLEVEWKKRYKGKAGDQKHFQALIRIDREYFSLNNISPVKCLSHFFVKSSRIIFSFSFISENLKNRSEKIQIRHNVSRLYVFLPRRWWSSLFNWLFSRLIESVTLGLGALSRRVVP